jgi:hypothetical protein
MPPPDVSLIGCCGAYCGTCRALLDKTCKGCKLGYDDGERDIRAARCAMKRCCLMEKKLETCADCQEYEGCAIIQGSSVLLHYFSCHHLEQNSKQTVTRRTKVSDAKTTAN